MLRYTLSIVELDKVCCYAGRSRLKTFSHSLTVPSHYHIRLFVYRVSAEWVSHAFSGPTAQVMFFDVFEQGSVFLTKPRSNKECNLLQSTLIPPNN